ncbi:TPA: DUF192 domain-containing protein [Candidatus Woesearchaeota archaeon]|nr:DUF192 domain-containing protein [Candidatus Woesearchaeota archaeon]HIH46724.1 DUF192 domain-containing protein [Candidatus Woesearchaeota archaeon]
MISSQLLARVRTLTKTSSSTPIVVFSSVFDKLFGLMFRKPDHCVYVFVFDHDVQHVFHTFFCKNLDFWFLDHHGRVIFTQKNVKPFSLMRCSTPYRYVVEYFAES